MSPPAIRYVDELAVAGKRVFLRVDFNVSLAKNPDIPSDLRIQKTLPTLRYLKEQGARIIVASHLGRPPDRPDPGYSLLPVAESLTELLSQEIIFPESCVGSAISKLARELKEGEVMLLENLRFRPEEKANDEAFARQLASYAEVYVNDAFGAMHRAHASVARIATFFTEKGAGFLVRDELCVLESLLRAPERPFWAILGGAKVADKIGVIDRLLEKVDGMILGGALAYTFLKAEGHAIGTSRLEEDKIHVARKALAKALSRDVPVLLPIDHRVAKEIGSEAVSEITSGRDIPAGQIGLDIGPKTIAQFQKALDKAATIFWNGPLGYFEVPPFAEGTRAIAETVARASGMSVVGGGDSLTALRLLGMEQKVSHLLTGGGASLAYLEGKKLPGLAALERRG